MAKPKLELARVTEEQERKSRRTLRRELHEVRIYVARRPVLTGRPLLHPGQPAAAATTPRLARGKRTRPGLVGWNAGGLPFLQA